MLYIVWNVWNEMENLPMAVDSLEKVVADNDVCKHIFVDGRYKDHPGEGWGSTDGTQGYCLDAGLLIRAEDQDEIGKYNLAWTWIDNVGRDNDWVLFLDADEELLVLSEPATEVGLISFVWDSDGEARVRARLYRWRPNLRFKGRHFTLYDGEDKLVASLDSPGQICGFGLHHNTSHPPERVKDKKAYYEQLRKKERGMPR